MALELDLPVEGAPLFGMSDVDFREKAESRSVINLGHLTESSVEKIIALQPDLILGSGFLDVNAPKLALNIAPTALTTAGDRRSYLKILIEVAGSEKKADDILSSYAKRVAEIRYRVPDNDISVFTPIVLTFK